MENCNRNDRYSVRRLNLEPNVDAQEQHVHDGSFCDAKHPLTPPITIPRLVQVCKGDPPVIVHTVSVAKDNQEGAQTQALGEKHFEEFFQGHKGQTDENASYGKYQEGLALNIEENGVAAIKPV